RIDIWIEHPRTDGKIALTRDQYCDRTARLQFGDCKWSAGARVHSRNEIGKSCKPLTATIERHVFVANTDHELAFRCPNADFTSIGALVVENRFRIHFADPDACAAR